MESTFTHTMIPATAVVAETTVALKTALQELANMQNPGHWSATAKLFIRTKITTTAVIVA